MQGTSVQDGAFSALAAALNSRPATCWHVSLSLKGRKNYRSQNRSTNTKGLLLTLSTSLTTASLADTKYRCDVKCAQDVILYIQQCVARQHTVSRISTHCNGTQKEKTVRGCAHPHLRKPRLIITKVGAAAALCSRENCPMKRA